MFSDTNEFLFRSTSQFHVRVALTTLLSSGLWCLWNIC